MMFFNFKRFLETTTGVYIISIVLGIGLASIFRKACNDRKCIVFKAAPIEDVKDQIFQFNGKCYKFEPKAESCDAGKNGKKIVNM